MLSCPLYLEMRGYFRSVYSHSKVRNWTRYIPVESQGKIIKYFQLPYWWHCTLCIFFSFLTLHFKNRCGEELKGGASVRPIYLQIEFLSESKSLWQTLVGTFFLKCKSVGFFPLGRFLMTLKECRANLPNHSLEQVNPKQTSPASSRSTRKLGLRTIGC